MPGPSTPRPGVPLAASSLSPSIRRSRSAAGKVLGQGLLAPARKRLQNHVKQELPAQGKALETAPQGGCKAKGTGPQQVVAKKDPPKSAGASSTVHKLGRKPKVSGSRAGKKTGAPGKTSTAASKAGKCAASLKGTKPAVKAAPGPGPKVIAAPKAATASKAGAPRTRTLSPARKAGGPKNPRPLVKRS